MTETKKPTPSQRVKELEAEVKRLEQALIKLNQHSATEQAEYGNGQYSLGYQEGLADGRAEMKAAVQAQSFIGRFFTK